VRCVEQVTDGEIEKLTSEYDEEYTVAPSLRAGGSQRQALREAARLEVGLRHFLNETSSNAFTAIRLRTCTVWHNFQGSRSSA